MTDRPNPPRDGPDPEATPPTEVTRARNPSSIVARLANPLQNIGPYKIVQTLGEGGMGVVYLAEQTKPIHRKVALKIIKLGMDTKQVMARFEAEREALALMNHPNVAKVFDAGATEQGRPYFVMEYVEGEALTKYCDRNRLPTKERLKLFMQVCHAVQHAHQKGIIHRDLKPSNVLVTKVDDAPAVKVIDFGIAKATQQRLTEATLFTEQGQLVGTPAYMSPEQADPNVQDIDTRTDIYSLGVILYQLLVGALPFEPRTLRSAALMEIVRIIREVDPPKPSTRLLALESVPRVSTSGPVASGEQETDSAQSIAALRQTDPASLVKQLRGDLDWIVMKCLEKDRARRYDSANGIALELERYLNHEPVLAGPPSATYRVGKFIRRNRLAVAAAAVVVLALTAGLVGTSVMYLRAEKARNETEIERDRADEEATEAKNQASIAEAVNQLMADMIKKSNQQEREGNPNITVREVMDTTARELQEGRTKYAPEVEAAMRHAIGGVYRSLGLFDPAETQFREALALRRKSLDNEHVDVAKTLYNLALVLDQEGKHAESEALHREALALNRSLLGDKHVSVATSLNGLAIAVSNQGRYGEADALWRESAGIIAGGAARGEQQRAMTIGNQALSLMNRGKYVESEALYRQALDLTRTQFGEKHPHVADTMAELGEVIRELGRYGEAEVLERDALAMRRGLFGDLHPDVADSLGRLANTLHKQGKYTEAETLAREGLAISRRVFGDEDRNVYYSMFYLGNALMAQGKFSEADVYYRSGLTLARKLLGAEHPDVLQAMGNFALLLSNQEKYAEAEVLCREVLALDRKISGEEHVKTADSLVRLAFVLGKQEKRADSELFYREGLALQRKLLGDEHPLVAEGLNNLADELYRQGRYIEAEVLFREALATRRKVLGDKHRRVADSLLGLALAIESQAKLEEAETVARQALEILRDKGPGMGAPLSLNYQVIAAILIGQGRYSEAETFLDQAGETLTGQTAHPRNVANAILQTRVRLYESWDAAEPGRGHAEKAAQWRAKLDETPKSQNSETPK